MTRPETHRPSAPPSRVRQFLAYAAVVASGSASIATTDCTEAYSEATPAAAVELGPAGSTAVVRFRVRTTLELRELGLTAGIAAGSGEVQVAAPDLLLDELPDDGSDGGVTSSFVVTDTGPRWATVCKGHCKSDVEVTLTRTAGSEPASVELSFRATSIDYDRCERDGESMFIVERVE